MRAPLALIPALAALPIPAAAMPLDCRFTAACIEAGLCTEIDRHARLAPDGPAAALLEMDGHTLAGSLAAQGPLHLFDSQSEGLRLLLGIAADGSARLMAMETDPLRVATYSGSCEEA